MENGVHGVIYTQINKLKQEQRGWILYSVCLVNKEALSEILENLNFRRLAPRSDSGLDIFNETLIKTRKVLASRPFHNFDIPHFLCSSRNNVRWEIQFVELHFTLVVQ